MSSETVKYINGGEEVIFTCSSCEKQLLKVIVLPCDETVKVKVKCRKCNDFSYTKTIKGKPVYATINEGDTIEDIIEENNITILDVELK